MSSSTTSCSPDEASAALEREPGPWPQALPAKAPPTARSDSESSDSPSESEPPSWSSARGPFLAPCAAAPRPPPAARLVSALSAPRVPLESLRELLAPPWPLDLSVPMPPAGLLIFSRDVEPPSPRRAPAPLASPAGEAPLCPLTRGSVRPSSPTPVRRREGVTGRRAAGDTVRARSKPSPGANRVLVHRRGSAEPSAPAAALLPAAPSPSSRPREAERRAISRASWY
mmetsp:Transcript_6672/g.19532  ORF Transcript_6672/g.19532 Transcript_6672/m.19532 type:complete len:228 (+) Transcript_6672:1937-2620(+)